MNILDDLCSFSINMGLVVVGILCDDPRMLKLSDVDSSCPCKRVKEVSQILQIICQIVALRQIFIEMINLLLLRFLLVVDNLFLQQK